MIISSGITIGNGITFQEVPGDPYWSSVTTLLSADKTTPPANNNTFLDSSGTVSVTRQGNTTQGSFNPFNSYSAGSLYLDGNGDYLNVASNAAFNLTGDFTIEYWFYDDGSNLNYPTIVSNATGWTLGSFGMRYNNLQEGKISVHWNGAGDPFIATTSTYATKTWYHVAFTRSGSTCILWVNGVNRGSGTYSAALNLSFGGLNVGWSAWDGAQGYYKGYVSNLRVVNGTALYTSTFTPSTTPLTAVSGTSLLLSGTNAGVSDSSASTDLETVSNSSLSTSVVKYGNTSIAFNGSSDYLLSKPSSALEFGSGDFTIEFWWYRTANGRQALYHGSFGTDWSLGIDFSSVGTSTIGIWASSNGTSWNLVNADSGGNGIGSIVIPLNTWTHIAYVRNGTNWYSFVNGVRDRNLSGISGTVVNRTSSQKAIGAWFSVPAMATASGYIADFRVTKGVARYTTNFSVPTQPYPQN